jgi:hypothetical protein
MANPPPEWQIDVLFGMAESMSVMISALIAHHPDREGLEAHMDFRLSPVRAEIIAANRSDLALEAFDDMTAAFKAVVRNQFHGWDQSSQDFQELRKRLTQRSE